MSSNAGPAYFAQTSSAVYRSAIVAVDVLAAPGTVTCTVQAGGSATANTYNVKVVAGNALGRTTAKAGNTTIVTATTNLTGRAAFALVTGAIYYDIYFSTDSDPKWVGRITEAQRLSGILLTAVNTTGAGGIAGAVDIQVPGTGLQAATTAVVNTAYATPGAAAIICAGYQYVHLDVAMSATGDAASPTLVLLPMFLNSDDSNFYAATAQTVTFGGTTGVYQPMIQRLTLEVRGIAALHVLVQTVTGTGASVAIRYSLS